MQKINIINFNYICAIKKWHILKNSSNNTELDIIQNKIITIINDHGFNPNFYANDVIQLNPLGYAVFYGNFEIVKNLVNKGSKFNCKINNTKRKRNDDNHFTNITYSELAFLRGHIEIKNFFDHLLTPIKHEKIHKNYYNFGFYSGNNIKNESFTWIKLDQTTLLLALFDGDNFVSQYLTKYFAEYVQVRFELLENKDPQLMKDMLSRAIQHINILICNIIDKFKLSNKMVSTLSCVIITNDNILGAWLGNSPILIFNKQGQDFFVSENNLIEKYIGQNNNTSSSIPDTFLINKNNDLIIALCNDSFNKSVKQISSNFLFQKQFIGNHIENKNIIHEILPIVKKNNFNMIKSTKEIVSYRISMFKDFCNNAKIILYYLN
jgi:hypothetical protein